jgi:bacteriorhodopsin
MRVPKWEFYALVGGLLLSLISCVIVLAWVKDDSPLEWVLVGVGVVGFFMVIGANVSQGIRFRRLRRPGYVDLTRKSDLP